MRTSHPVGGCYGIISDLYRQIAWIKAELEIVLYQLSICKGKAQMIATQPLHQKVVDDVQDQVNAIGDQGLQGFNMYDSMPVHDKHCLEEGNVFQNSYGSSSSLSTVYNVFDPNFVKVELEGSLVHKRAFSDVAEDIKPLLAVFDDKGAGTFPFDFKGSSTIQCRDKLLVSKGEIRSIHHELKHDLKDAASLFTLKNGKG